MDVSAQKETLGFQAEVAEVLHLVIHSLYSHKEIFLRELISNASDALDKLRFQALADSALYENDAELEVHVTYDKAARTLTVSDNGIGMSRQEVIDNLGTIAKSGTREFIKSLTGDKAKDSRLIGQFGVGFYSAFIVADKVTVLTRRAGAPVSEAVCWQSTGDGQYSIELTEKRDRGTDIILHLKPEEDEFLDDFRLKNIITKYSDHIAFPICMLKAAETSDKEAEDKTTEPTFEVVNKATALWTLPKNEIKDEEYEAFYKHLAHDFEKPLAWIHNRVEGKLDYTTLFYIPARAPFDLWHREQRHGVKLYVQRVFIMDDADAFMPTYLRFVRGVIDSNDLPLNVSRELLQNNRIVETLRAASVKKVLGLLEKLAEDKEKYATFWAQFGEALKEGPAEDFANKETIAKLLRFASTRNETDVQNVSLDDYIANMKPDQEKIYYITAESYLAAKNSPHLEIFRKKGVEVLLLFHRVDEWLVAHLTEFAGKLLQSVAKGALQLGKLADEASKQVEEKWNEEYKDLLTRVKEVLGDKIKEVRTTSRLTASPACLVADEHDLGIQMQRMLKAAGQSFPGSKPIFELNPEHVMIQKLANEVNGPHFADWTHILFDQALLAEGGQLEDPAGFVKRLNELLLALAKPL